MWSLNSEMTISLLSTENIFHNDPEIIWPKYILDRLHGKRTERVPLHNIDDNANSESDLIFTLGILFNIEYSTNCVAILLY